MNETKSAGQPVSRSAGQRMQIVLRQMIIGLREPNRASRNSRQTPPVSHEQMGVATEFRHSPFVPSNASHFILRQHTRTFHAADSPQSPLPESRRAQPDDHGLPNCGIPGWRGWDSESIEPDDWQQSVNSTPRPGTVPADSMAVVSVQPARSSESLETED